MKDKDEEPPELDLPAEIEAKILAMLKKYAEDEGYKDLDDLVSNNPDGVALPNLELQLTPEENESMREAVAVANSKDAPPEGEA